VTSNDFPRAAVHVLTGFLGSGKTTLLRHLLGHASMKDSVVIVNELGDIAVDDALISEVRDDMVVLASGCVCCSMRDDLVRSLCDLVNRTNRGELARFQRVIIETTGLADPTRILAALTKNGLVTRHYQLETLVSTVDGTIGASNFDRHPEAVKQAAMADRIVLTKGDLASPSELTALRERIRRIQPRAPIVSSVAGRLAPTDLFGKRPAHLAPDALPEGYGDEHALHDSHGDGVRTFSVALPRAVSFDALALWLSTMTQFHGDNLLRVKGIVRLVGESDPVVVQAVQHVVYPTYSLPGWPREDLRSHLVFITRDLEPSLLASIPASLRALTV